MFERTRAAVNPISLQGRYRTRSGKSVRILCIDAESQQPVIGISDGNCMQWNADGAFWPDGARDSAHDLIEVTAPPPTPLEAAARDIKERLEYFAAEGVRPDEWLLKEWAAKLAAALK